MPLSASLCGFVEGDVWAIAGKPAQETAASNTSVE
jgi:hypothetical protein